MCRFQSRRLGLSHHVTLKDERCINSVRATSILTSRGDVYCLKSCAFIFFPTTSLPPSLPPSRLADSVEEAGSHGYRQSSRVTLPRGRLPLLSGFVPSSL